MKTSSALLLASTLGGVFAAPASTQSGVTFSATTTFNGKSRHVAHDLERAFNKYVPAEKRAEILASLASSNTARSTGSAITNPEPNSDHVDALYLTEVKIGTPAQTLKLDFDTGSSDLWVFSTDTDSSVVNGQTLYNPKSSTSAKQIPGETWAIHYADESQCSGIIYSDDVTVGGLTVKGQAVESAQTVSQQFTDDAQSSGLLGLALSKGNTASPTKQKTWFDNISASLDKKLFTVRLRHQAAGSYNFGYIDSKQYSGAISYTPASTDDLGHRLFKSNGYSIGSGATKSASITGTADTGTSLFILPDTIANAYWAGVKGAQKVAINNGAGHAWLYPCSTTLPSFNFNVGSGKATVPGADMNFAPNGNGQCVGGIATLSGLGGISIFGDVALKSNLVIFDDANNQLGWAKGL
ncbi:hypothetical protein VHEMI01614 [[Torrubiella] hemipterigena]|uniref:Peptidase A1 domain-containing protein n=1 Tax=[Torrubiella] hemipterigena TaxID=1531966 RepID=A0A0A1T5A5_9HYPO|nr:hypothetical protein VHEMI01614 [[Torrubiella] hemipterigena]